MRCMKLSEHEDDEKDEASKIEEETRRLMEQAMSEDFGVEEGKGEEPSAELKPDQCDQDDLPPYEVLDPILTGYLEEHLGIDEIAARGFDRQVVEDVIRRILLNEHKRKQAPLGLKVTSKAFGHGRRYPIVHRFRA